MRGLLLLEDGSVFIGCGFGSEGTRVGEVVFTTSMVGYPESITDPSYMGQILIETHPLVGNYGVAKGELSIQGIPLHFESSSPKIEGFIVPEETIPNHWSSEYSLHDWLAMHRIPALSRVDTRALVRKIREAGVMKGLIHVWKHGEPNLDELREHLRKAPNYDELPLAYYASPREPMIHGDGGPTVAILDCGVKYGIIREILKRGFRVIRYPCTAQPHELVSEAKAVVLSNGPGNPAILEDVVANVNELIEYNIPILGICLGHQLVGLASGARVIKLKYGHRGANKPVKDLTTGRCYITTQNHGYALDPESINPDFDVWFINADDGTIEGLMHRKKPILTVQFHPEASPGPHDTTWIFDKFLKELKP